MNSPARNYSDSRTATGPLVFVSGQLPLDEQGQLAGETMTETLVAVQALVDPRFLPEIDAAAVAAPQ
jgi:enamine deaminase RidA (YjgF/YER057c/UK114 family)